MPHICTRCNSVFESGEDILKGCPSCGWKKFMFVRKIPQDLDMAAASSEDEIITRAMGVRMPPKRAKIPRRTDRGEQLEDLPRLTPIASSLSSPAAIPALSSKEPEAVNLEKVQNEGDKLEGKALESIKITAPGTYELNLPSLFERNELIMAVKEGTYFIDLTSVFKKSKKG